jgi:DNA polymerase-1
MMASAPILGACFVIKTKDEDSPDAGAVGSQATVSSLQQNDSSQDTSTETSCFILPLGPAKDGDGNPIAADPGYERMSDWPAIFDCETSIPDRWKALRSILLDKQLTCITYNAAVGLLPYHYHRENDGVALGADGQMTGGQTDLIFPRLWDLRLTSWILNPDRGDAELEFANIYNGFSHLRNDSASTNRIPTNASEQLLGLIKVQDFLEFLLVIYPMIDRQLDQKGLRAAYDDIEGPTTSILSAMETSGIGFVTEHLIALQQKLEARIDELTAEAKKLARDNEFLLSSPQQVAHLLYDVMHIHPPELQGVSKAKTKSRSTSEESLKMIQSEAKRRGQKPHRIIEIILEFRSLNKTLTTYARPLPLLARDMSPAASRKKKRSKRSKKQWADSNPSIQRIHPNWMQTAVRTGRLSCRKPNIQQVPTEGAFGTNIRDSFRASSSEKCLFACDYSQNEIRILAHMSNDQALVGMFRSREEIDIYKQMSAAIRGIRIEDVTDDDRKISKQVTLGKLYLFCHH